MRKLEQDLIDLLPELRPRLDAIKLGESQELARTKVCGEDLIIRKDSMTDISITNMGYVQPSRVFWAFEFATIGKNKLVKKALMDTQIEMARAVIYELKMLKN